MCQCNSGFRWCVTGLTHLNYACNDPPHIIVRNDNRIEMCTLLSELPITSQKFFGRISELEQMHQAFSTSQMEQTGVVLWVLGGSGKSRLTLRYLELYQKNFSEILWINAASQESVNESFSHLVPGIEVLERTRRSALTHKAGEEDRSFVKRWLSSVSNNA